MTQQDKFYRGPGTVIKETLRAWGITESSGCYCNEIASKMDSDGPDLVEKKLDHYTDEMKKSIERWRSGFKRIVFPIPPSSIIRSLIQYGINTSRRLKSQHPSAKHEL